jgi:soluble lytic murein transglycosylase-like protein
MNVDGILAGISQPDSGSARPAKTSADKEQAQRACKEFESILIYHMLSTMRKAFESDEDSETSFGSGIFKSMMDEQLSIAMARSGGIGLALLLERGLGLSSEEGASGRRVGGIFRPSAVRKSIATPGRPTQDSSGSRSKGFEPYEATIRAASKVFGISANLIRAVIVQESGGDSGAVSHKGAKGLMQLTDATARELGVTNPFDPVQNIFGGARLLARLLGTFRGNLELALAGYNAGQGAVNKYGGIPPYRETQDYVKNVIRNLKGLGAASGKGP